jgi:hypothetical protein
MSLPKLNSFCNIKFQNKTSAMKKWLITYKGNFSQLNKPQIDITWKLMIYFIYKPNCILTAQMNASLPFIILQRVIINLPPAYYNTAITIIGTINEDLELLDIKYVHSTLANCYLARQLPYN